MPSAAASRILCVRRNLKSSGHTLARRLKGGGEGWGGRSPADSSPVYAHVAVLRIEGDRD